MQLRHLILNFPSAKKEETVEAETPSLSPDPDAEVPEGDGPEPTYTITLPISKRKIWVADDTFIRTVSFTHDGSGVLCSKDAGVTYIPCSDLNSFIWKSKNFSVEHKIKFFRVGSKSAVYSFIPSLLFPDITFVNCDGNVKGNIRFDTFKENLNRAPNRTLCLNNAAYIHNSGADSAMDLYENNVRLISRQGDTSVFNAESFSSILNLVGASGFSMVGITLRFNYNNNDRYILKSSGAENVYLDSVSMTNMNTTSSDGGRLITATSGFVSAPLKIHNSEFDSGSGFGVEFLSSTSVAEITDSSIVGRRGALSNAGWMKVTDSTLGANGSTASAKPILISGGRLDLTDSTVYDSAGRGAIHFATSSGTVNMNGSMIRRGYSNSSFSSTVFYDGTGTSHVVNGSGNVFCNEAVSPTFTGVVSSGFITGTAITGASVIFCPYE